MPANSDAIIKGRRQHACNPIQNILPDINDAYVNVDIPQHKYKDLSYKRIAAICFQTFVGPTIVIQTTQAKIHNPTFHI